MKNIILIGGPGSGKSTYAEFLVKEFGMTHIYPGELLRRAKSKGGEIADRLKNLGQGGFAPNDIVLKLVSDAIKKADKGFVLDGWPRHMQQVKDMEKLGVKIDNTVYLDVSRKEVLKRLTARGRVDDKPDVINKRIDLYKKETGPVINYLRDKPGFITIKAEGDTPENIAKSIITKLKGNKTFSEMKTYLSEGVYDPGIFKAYFLAGGPGSGKTFVTRSAFAGTGLKVVNSDNFFERALKKANLSLSLPDEEEYFRNIVRAKSKISANTQLDTYLQGRLGVVIDATGRNDQLILRQQQHLQQMGYDTYMIFVNTSLDVALERQKKRERQVPEYIAINSWKKVQQNIGKFQKIFKYDKLLILDNNKSEQELVTQTLNRASAYVRATMNKPVQNYVAKQWIQKELEARKRR